MNIFNIFKRQLQPFNTGYLPTAEGHSIYFYQYGNPNGIPVLSFHGGPGGCSNSKYAKLFDLKKYRIIQYDQRGGGLSKYENLLENNTTADLLNDALKLLKYLKIEQKIIVQGCSWGATMALLFAEKYSDKVSHIVVNSVFLARQYDIDWVKKESERFYPDIMQNIKEQVNNIENWRDIYMDMLNSNDENLQKKFLTYLGSYEYMLGQLDPKFSLRENINEEELRCTRIAFHYERNNYFITENQIINNAYKIKNTPTLIVQNRLDFCCPIKQAWDLHNSLPKSTLHIVADKGHVSPTLMKECKKAIEQFLSN